MGVPTARVSLPNPRFDGKPLKIEVFSLPFVCVSDAREHCMSLDVRVTKLRKLEPKYVELVNKKIKEAPPSPWVGLFTVGGEGNSVEA